VLYVNNIRAYYNIVRWLTENEEQPKENAADDDLVAALGEEAL